MSFVVALFLQPALAGENHVDLDDPGARVFDRPTTLSRPGLPHDCLNHPGRTYRNGRPSYIGSRKSDQFPIKVHWDRAEDKDKALYWMEWLELSWQVQVEEQGFRPPQLPDAAEGAELDLYLTNKGVDEWAAFASPDDYRDDVGGDRFMSTSAYMVAHRDITEKWIPSYAAHEFNHVLQWATDYTEPTYPIWEAVATNETTWTYGYDERGRWYASVQDFQVAPYGPSLVGFGDDLYGWYGEGFYFEYGGAMWVRHIDEILGKNDGSTGAKLWNATAQKGNGLEPDVVDAVIEVSTMELGEFMNSLALSRWLVGEEWDDRGFADAKDWEPARKVPAYEFTGADIPEDGLLPKFSPKPMPTGQAFVDLDPTDAPDTHLTMSATSEAGNDSAIAVFTWDDKGKTDEFGDWGSEPVVTIELEGLERVVIVFSNLGPPAFDPDDDKHYKLGDQEWRIDPGEEALSGARGGNGGNNKGSGGCSSVPIPATVGGLALALLGLRRRR